VPATRLRYQVEIKECSRPPLCREPSTHG